MNNNSVPRFVCHREVDSHASRKLTRTNTTQNFLNAHVDGVVLELYEDGRHEAGVLEVLNNLGLRVDQGHNSFPRVLALELPLQLLQENLDNETHTHTQNRFRPYH